MSPAEMAFCQCLAANRSNLGSFCEAFSTAAQLFELLERGGGPPSAGVLGGPFIQFRIIAAKESAMNIFHFGNTLDAIKKQIPRCPTSQNTVDVTKVREA